MILLPLALSLFLQAEGPAPQPPETPAVVEQDGPKRPKLPAGLAKRMDDPYAELVPGALPKDTTPEAKALFQRLVDSAGSPGVEREALRSFDLAFEIITRGEGAQHNQTKLRVRYSEPGYVRFSVGKDKEMGFGASGCWQRFEDGAKWLNGRDYVSDRKRITEVRAVAKNFLALADPRRLRLTSLQALLGPPGHVPPGTQKKLAELAWLQLQSPDFDLALGAPEGEGLQPLVPRLFRATLGLDASTGRVVEALVQELDKGAPLVATSTWVSLSAPNEATGTNLPASVFVRYPDIQSKPWAFEAKIREQLYLLEGRLNPTLGPKDFEPERL